MPAPCAAGPPPDTGHLFTGEPDHPRLIGSRCAHCAVTVFPLQAGCPRCGSGDMREIEYADTGTLWTFTTQGFPPKSPPYVPPPESEFTPYAVGYVEFSGQGLVEGRIECTDPSALRIGMPMRVDVRRFGGPDDAATWWIHCFRPIAEM